MKIHFTTFVASTLLLSLHSATAAMPPLEQQQNEVEQMRMEEANGNSNNNASDGGMVNNPPPEMGTLSTNQQQMDYMATMGTVNTFSPTPVDCLPGDDGFIFSSSNAHDGNDLLVYCRHDDGMIEFGGSIPTGGVGGSAGSILDPLGSNHPVTLSENGKCLLVVNAGSNTVTSFEIMNSDGNHQVRYVDQYESGGFFPVTIATSTNMAYVLNSGLDGTIAPFSLDEENGCTMALIEDGIRSLEYDHTNPPVLSVSPGSIKLTPDKSKLVLTIKGFNQGLIVVYGLDPGTGVPGRGTYTVSSGFTPFSIDFDSMGNLLITEENGAAPEPPVLTELNLPRRLGAVSSYRFTKFGTLEPISKSVPNDEAAPCWSAIQGQCVFIANVVSGSISSYIIDESSGELTLASGAAADVPAALDLYIENGILYSLSAIEGPGGTQPSLNTFEILEQGCGLRPLIQTFTDGLPTRLETLNGVTGLTVL